MATGVNPGIRFCSECGRPAAPEDLAHFGDRLVCGFCKDIFAQKLREGVPLAHGVTLAGFWIRAGAYAIDLVILAVAQGAVQMPFAGKMLAPMTGIQPNAPPEQALAALGAMMGMAALAALLGMVVGSLYEGLFVARFAATPGKMALCLKVVRPNGAAVGLGRAFGRYFAKFVSGMIFWIGFIMVALDSEKRGLHDLICDTRVIRTPA